MLVALVASEKFGNSMGSEASTGEACSTVTPRSNIALRSAACKSSVATAEPVVSEPDCSNSDRCNASNIWLMFAYSCSEGGAQIGFPMPWLLQICVHIQQCLRSTPDVAVVGVGNSFWFGVAGNV